ncbi:MAG: cytochrome c peroxidase [Bryobacter sp.]|nr:cytochrome c peroxidase [Bryobacter sp.]
MADARRAIAVFLASCGALSLLAIEVPLGLDRFVPTPAHNPLRPAAVARGKELFFDKRLSRDGSIACATCHKPELAFSDENAVAIGIAGRQGNRRTPRLANRAWGKSFFWDGRAKTLEEQVIGPIGNSLEMDLDPTEAARRVGLSLPELQSALASYVRTIFSGDSKYDRYLAGDAGALSGEEKRGLELFRGKAGCATCHLGPLLTDEEYHVTGAGAAEDAGRFQVTQQEDDRGAFKTPSLRDVARTPPYMHDGSLANLDDVLRFYQEGGKARNNLDPEMRKLNLSEAELQSLKAFLLALNGRLSDGLR